MTLVQVAKLNEIEESKGKVVEAEGKKIAIFKIEGQLHAIAHECPHKGGPLGEGEVEGSVVTCPWHQWKFDLKSGVSPVNSKARVAKYMVKVEDNKVLVDV